MATIRIEPPRRHYYIYYRDRAGKQHHPSSGIPHSPEGATPKEREERAKENKRICLALANNIESAECGNKSQAYIKALFTGALQRAMGVYSQDGSNGMTAVGYLQSWLDTQTHLNEGRMIYQGHINSFSEYLGNRGTEPLMQLDQRDTQGFKDAQLQAGLAATTINKKLEMLEAAFSAAVRRGLMLANIVSEDDYLEEDRMRRKPFTLQQIEALHERWAFLGRTDPVNGPLALEWITASKFAALQGMRLGDAISQVRGNIDFGTEENAFVTWVPEKTAHLQRIVILPLHSNLRKHLLPLEPADPQLLFSPLLAAIKRPDLSNRFKRELLATGIDPETSKLSVRSFSALTFHSFKHFYVDSLDKALVPRDRRKLLAAHSSDEAHARYEHPWTRKDAEVLRADIEKLPQFAA
ncbi:MAG: site-specific integrase [Verrucomicrobiota bacterium]|jgi:integrase